MKKMFLKRWGSLILIFGFLLAAAASATGAQKAANHADAVDSVTLYPDTPLSAKDSQNLRRLGGSATFTVWGELQDMTVADPDLGSKVQTNALVLDGSSELVLPLTPVLPAGDTNGCLLGEQTAWELFGSTQVKGDTILIGNQTRIIRGVVSLPQSGVVIEGSVNGITGSGTDTAEESRYYNRITVEGGKVEDAELFLMQVGLEGKVLRMDYLRSLRWLTELIPGKWSDFSGWKENFKQKKQDFGLLSKIDKNCVELYYENQCRLYIWDTVLEAACVMGALVCFLKSGIVSSVYSALNAGLKNNSSVSP